MGAPRQGDKLQGGFKSLQNDEMLSLRLGNQHDRGLEQSDAIGFIVSN